MIRLATPADLSQAAEIYEEILDQEQQGPVYTNWQRGQIPHHRHRPAGPGGRHPLCG